MIKILILLAKRFSFINRWFFEISKYYLPPVCNPQKEIEIRTVEKIVNVPIYVDKYIDRIVEVPFETIKIVEVIKEIEVIKEVEVIKEIFIEKPVFVKDRPEIYGPEKLKLIEACKKDLERVQNEIMMRKLNKEIF